MLSAPPRQCEQVLSHFLSDTIDSDARDAIFIDFKTCFKEQNGSSLSMPTWAG